MPPGKTERREGALGAIETVLEEAAQPLHYLEITRRVLSRRLWRSAGKTPAQTIKARLTVDIQEKGAASRFVRLERGVYGLKKKSAKPAAKPVERHARRAGARIVSGQSYRVLSIHGPWAWAIVFGGKNVENRSWSTPYRGTILIHASSRKLGGKALAEVREALADLTRKALAKIPTEFPRSQIIGMVELVDCTTDHPSSWASLGSVHWVLKRPRPLAEPIAGVDGKLNLWTWTAP